MSDPTEDDRMLAQMKLNDNDNLEHIQDDVDLDTLMNKVTVDDNEAKDIFNSMLKDIEGKLDVDDSTDLMAKNFLTKSKSQKENN